MADSTLPTLDDAAASGRRPERLLPDDFWMFEYKVLMCPKRESHDWERCIYAHRGERARRRHPSKYQAVQCPEARAKKVCPRGEACPCTHHLFEYWLHPDRYLTCLCELGPTCNRPICFFAHERSELRPLPAGLVSASELNPGQAWQHLSAPSSRASTPPAAGGSGSSSPLRQNSSPMAVSAAVTGPGGGSVTGFNALDLLSTDDALMQQQQQQRTAGAAGGDSGPTAAVAAMVGGPPARAGSATNLGVPAGQGSTPAFALQAGPSSNAASWPSDLGAPAAAGGDAATNKILAMVQPVKIIRSMSDGYTPAAVMQQQQQQQMLAAASGYTNSTCSSPMGFTGVFQPESAAAAARMRDGIPSSSAGSSGLSPRNVTNALDLLDLGARPFSHSNLLGVGLQQQATADMAAAAQQLRQQQQTVNGFALINSAVDPQLMALQQAVDDTPEHLSFSLWDLEQSHQQQQQLMQQQLHLQQQQQQAQVLSITTPAAGSPAIPNTAYSPSASPGSAGMGMSLSNAGNAGGSFTGFQSWSPGEFAAGASVSNRAAFVGRAASFGGSSSAAADPTDLFDVQQRMLLLQQQQQQLQARALLQQQVGMGQGDNWWPLMSQQQQQQQQQQQPGLGKSPPGSSWMTAAGGAVLQPQQQQQQLLQQPQYPPPQQEKSQHGGGKREKGSTGGSSSGLPGVLAAAMMSQVQELMARKNSTAASSGTTTSGEGSKGPGGTKPSTPSTPGGSASAKEPGSGGSAGGDAGDGSRPLLSAWLSKATTAATRSPAPNTTAAAVGGQGEGLAAPLSPDVLSALAKDVVALMCAADVLVLVEKLQAALHEAGGAAPAQVPSTSEEQ